VSDKHDVQQLVAEIALRDRAHLFGGHRARAHVDVLSAGGRHAVLDGLFEHRRDAVVRGDRAAPLGDKGSLGSLQRFGRDLAAASRAQRVEERRHPGDRPIAVEHAAQLEHRCLPEPAATPRAARVATP
jgi:hypothetical protein